MYIFIRAPARAGLLRALCLGEQLPCRAGRAGEHHKAYMLACLCM